MMGWDIRAEINFSIRYIMERKTDERLNSNSLDNNLFKSLFRWVVYIYAKEERRKKIIVMLKMVEHFEIIEFSN